MFELEHLKSRNHNVNSIFLAKSICIHEELKGINFVLFQSINQRWPPLHTVHVAYYNRPLYQIQCTSKQFVLKNKAIDPQIILP